MKYGIPAGRLAGRNPRPTGDSCLEKARHPLGYGQPEMLVGPFGQHASARGALDQPLLQQVRLENVLDRVGLPADPDPEGREADGPPPQLPPPQPGQPAGGATETGP